MDKPLALKLAPKSLKEVYGQSHLIGKDRVLTNMVKNKKIFSMILYGRPGIGKTSIANAIVNELDGLVKNIYIEDLENETEKYILDVRTKEEFEDGHISSAINIPLDELRQNLYKLDKSKEIIVHCRTGLRSYIACRILTQNGFNVKNLVGGYYLYSFMKGEEKYDE